MVDQPEAHAARAAGDNRRTPGAARRAGRVVADPLLLQQAHTRFCRVRDRSGADAERPPDPRGGAVSPWVPGAESEGRGAVQWHAIGRLVRSPSTAPQHRAPNPLGETRFSDGAVAPTGRRSTSVRHSATSRSRMTPQRADPAENGLPLLHSSSAQGALSAGYGLRPAFWPQDQFVSNHTPIRQN